MIEENLSKLGFSPSEIKIYLHLNKNGKSWANKISSETKINRTNVYEALDRLIAKGVVSFIIKNKVKWFEANSSNSLVKLAKEKETEFFNLKKLLLNQIDELNILKNSNEPLEATIFTGKKGLRMIFEEIIDNEKPISLIGSKLQIRDVFGPYFDLWHIERIERKIYQRSIFPIKYKGKLENRKFLEYKFVDNKYTNPTTTIIYGENCIFIQWAENPVAIKIINKEISKSHLNYFNMLWNS